MMASIEKTESVRFMPGDQVQIRKSHRMAKVDGFRCNGQGTHIVGVLIYLLDTEKLEKQELKPEELEFVSCH